MEQHVVFNLHRGCEAPQPSQAVIAKYCQAPQPDAPQKVAPTEICASLWAEVCSLAVLESLLTETVPENWQKRGNMSFTNEQCSCNRTR